MNSIIELKLGRSYKTTPLFSYRIFSEDISGIDLNTPVEKMLISTINPHSFYVAEHDLLFKEALQNSKILLPDGVGIVLANRLLNFSKISKISGTDIFEYLLKKLNESTEASRRRIYFLGSSVENLDIIKSKIKEDFPALAVGCYSPPFKSEFSNEERKSMVDAINNFVPYILFVGMTAPKQEKWAYQNFYSVDASVVCSIGAVFDFYSGKIKRPGFVWQWLGLEWLGRIIREPFRLWRRTLISMPYFVWKVFIEFVKKSLRV